MYFSVRCWTFDVRRPAQRHRRCRFCPTSLIVGSGVATAAVLAFSVCLFAQSLPGDSTLPGESTLPGRKRVVALPSEATLPGTMVNQVEAATDQLPGEDRLPASSESASATEQTEPDAPNDKTQPSPSDIADGGDVDAGPAEADPESGDIPWLRLNLNAHSAQVRSLAFSRDGQRLFSGGDDKQVEVWSPALEPGRWTHTRTLRWQIQRGPRGRIYSLATGPGLVAVAGHGAMGGLGEIMLYDSTTGALKRALVDINDGHRQVVASLAFSPSDGQTALASMDLDGCVMHWSQDPQSGLWTSRRLLEADAEFYGDKLAEQLKPLRRFVPIAMAQDGQVIVPIYQRRQVFEGRPEGVPVWRLEQIDVRSGRRQPLAEAAPHYGMVTSMATSADGRRLVSADAYGRLHIWTLTGTPRVHTLSPRKGAFLTLSVSGDGRYLLAGTNRTPAAQDQAVLQRWRLDTDPPQLLDERTVKEDILACALDSEQFAYTQGNDVVMQPIESSDRAARRLQAAVRPIGRVAFVEGEPRYRIAFESRAMDGEAPVRGMYDTNALQLDQLPADDATDPTGRAGWGLATRWRGGWGLAPRRDADGESYWLHRDRQWKARLPLRPERHGVPTATCWLPDRNGRPYAVAVGTSGANNIYVFRLAEDGVCPLLRQFRGHGSTVTALNVASNLRYLVSGAADATIAVWKLADFLQDSPLVQRWGIEVEQQEDELVVVEARADGPLYFRGMRAGDTVEAIRWYDGRQLRDARTPAAIRAALANVDWDTIVEFEYRRGRVPQDGFQMFPAWQQTVSLVVADNREWAYWTPAGYYDASFNGNRLFGWQVNRGVDRVPDFFLAAQLRRNLERPDVMRRILESGSLRDAFRAARQAPPVEADRVVAEQYRLKPHIQILSPLAEQSVDGGSVQLEAAIRLRPGLQLVAPKAFANGVPGIDRELVSRGLKDGMVESVYRWTMRLPSESRVLLQVVAGTDADTADLQSVVVQQQPAERGRPRMFVLAAGVNQYQDAQIQRLDYAVNNVSSFENTLRRQAGTLYETDVVALHDERATRWLWSVVADDYVSSLAEQVGPDDLLVVFLSGHGLRDAKTGNYYFVAADARYDDLRAERYEDCISFADLARFGQLPCRKLVILDTCHSGAVQQPLEMRQLKAAVRVLQDDLALTLTASEGGEEAVEEKQRQLGRFTFRLLEAVRGAADRPAQGGNADQVVTLDEVVSYVQRHVAQDSADSSVPQHPTAGPLELLEYVRLPLTEVAASKEPLSE